MSIFISIVAIFLATIGIVLSIRFGKKYYKHVLDNYDSVSDLESACVFGLLFMSICIGTISIVLSLGYIVSRVLYYIGEL
ncbi:hypothetical protein F422_gp041 [Staphylococcus phage SA11]|uniref:Uncharacterized protein n=1 Tax=Staphylococcus phage SA11 TaxID=2927988 RepID=I7DMW6_9CAUD|nr:hypothetical protein F422_gp041 [Staphylococcus phage SA11]APC43017.1 hypothetical protein SAP1_152 [Staphylococcus phage StAP1]UGL60812.1 hypothetical protein [Staphylococcus phage vB_SauM-HM01]WBF47846.1 hypothetical protein SSP49_21 [Staphylococcus phage SSP49]WJZ48699.1 hypothetical protein SAC_68 [Staphylococcus phage SAC]AFO70628.1 hypothetical protein [Staphylococcus phage SA11]